MRALILGALAGAVGTLATDITGYGDMALRGRSPSELPGEVIRRLALKAGVPGLGTPSDEADSATRNRRNALGALCGYGIGIMLGALYGALSRGKRTRRGLLVRSVVLGALAMAASDVPATQLAATNPAQWGPSSWLSDIVPHAAYGLVTATAFATIAG